MPRGLLTGYAACLPESLTYVPVYCSPFAAHTEAATMICRCPVGPALAFAHADGRSARRTAVKEAA